MGCSFKSLKRIASTNTFQKVLAESNRKANKIFYDRSTKSFLQNNDIEMYLTHNEEKYVVAKRFIRT